VILSVASVATAVHRQVRRRDLHPKNQHLFTARAEVGLLAARVGSIPVNLRGKREALRCASPSSATSADYLPAHQTEILAETHLPERPRSPWP
jgi:hypothetical protein